MPLLFELYAEGRPEPVARYEAQDFHVGPVPDARFEFETPPDATVEAAAAQGRSGGRISRRRRASKVASVEEASELAGFAVEAYPRRPGAASWRR